MRSSARAPLVRSQVLWSTELRRCACPAASQRRVRGWWESRVLHLPRTPPATAGHDAALLQLLPCCGCQKAKRPTRPVARVGRVESLPEEEASPLPRSMRLRPSRTDGFVLQSPRVHGDPLAAAAPGDAARMTPATVAHDGGRRGAGEADGEADGHVKGDDVRDDVSCGSCAAGNAKVAPPMSGPRRHVVTSGGSIRDARTTRDAIGSIR